MPYPVIAYDPLSGCYATYDDHKRVSLIGRSYTELHTSNPDDQVVALITPAVYSGPCVDAIRLRFTCMAALTEWTLRVSRSTPNLNVIVLG